jgi:hypothetical protein
MDNAHNPATTSETAEALTTDSRLAAFYKLYNTLSPETAGTQKLRRCLAEVYHPDIVFSDPMHRILGIDALEKYFEGLYENITYIDFQFHKAWVDSGSGSVHWTMRYRHPRLKAGKHDIIVDGVTILRWEGNLVVQHQDIFDAGSLLYEHLPVIGWLIHKLKERMA